MPGLLLTVLALHGTLALMSSLVADPAKRSQLTLALLSSALPVWLAARMSTKLQYYLRLGVYLGGLASAAAFGIVASASLALMGMRENANFVVARFFYGLVGPLTGVKITVEGTEHLPKKGEVAVMIGNHQSMIDILYLGAFLPKRCSIMAKKSLLYTPILGQFMWLSNAVFVDRANRKSALEQFRKVGEIMKRKAVSLFIFAEGTRSATVQPTLLPFKKGAFHLAVEGQIPIVPVVCENYSNIYNARARRFAAGEMIIRVLPPISTKGLTSASEDIAKLSDSARDAMLDALGELASRKNSASASTIVERDGQKALEMSKGKPKTS